MTAAEFLRRYEAMPHVRKAELIEGVVFMPSPVRIDEHGRPDGLVQAWLGCYAGRTPGTDSCPNTTLRLDADNMPQPDGMLRLRPECGGRTTVDEDGLLCGPVELVVEIAASSASIDARDKWRAYRRNGIKEYILWRTLDGQLDWWVLEDDEYRSNPPDAQRLIHSAGFPGLVLAVDALLAMDSGKVLDALQAALRDPSHEEFVARLKSAGAR